MTGQREVTMVDVARAAGVSIATVSRVLNNAPGVGAATRERVRREAERLAYVVSPEASGLSRRTTGRVGIVVPYIATWFYSSMLSELEKVLRPAGMDVVIYQIDGPEERRRFFRELPARRKVDAVVLVALPVTNEEAGRLADLKVQVLVLGAKLLDYPSVRIDDTAAARAAVKHLADLGHERIGMVTAADAEVLYWSPVVERARGYVAALTEAGLEPRPGYEVRHPYGFDAGREGVRRLIELDEPPTAVLVYSDEMAVGVLRGLQESGLSAPQELSVMSFDGHPLAELFGISTIDQHVHEQARTAGQMILRLLAGQPCPRDVIIDTELISRESTGAPNSSAQPAGGR